MNKAIIKFSSVTYALKAKDVITDNGGKAQIRKNPNPKKGEGCGYSLIAVGNISRIISLLDTNKIKYTGYEMVR
ncbi:MAG: DUF3343 domain-containing protein [Oscillospiraceae bacterium]|nr:DUF3343 domain-containing protein [Oscillospiraceae bacterium]